MRPLLLNMSVWTGFSRCGIFITTAPGRASSAAAARPAHALARDEAFSFTYPHLLAHWRAAGQSSAFSRLLLMNVRMRTQM